MSDTLINASANLLAVLIPALVGMAIEYLRKKAGDASFQKIQRQLQAKEGLAWIAVSFVEQTSDGLSSKQKFDKASIWLKKEAANIGINLTDEQVEALIESAVNAFSSSIKTEITELAEISE